MKTSKRLIKYLGAIILSYILSTVIPVQVVSHITFTNIYAMEMVYLLLIIGILAVTVIVCGEKKVFAFSLKSFIFAGFTFTVHIGFILLSFTYQYTNRRRKRPQRACFSHDFLADALFLCSPPYPHKKYSLRRK